MRRTDTGFTDSYSYQIIHIPVNEKNLRIIHRRIFPAGLHRNAHSSNEKRSASACLWKGPLPNGTRRVLARPSLTGGDANNRCAPDHAPIDAAVVIGCRRGGNSDSSDKLDLAQVLFSNETPNKQGPGGTILRPQAREHSMPDYGYPAGLLQCSYGAPAEIIRLTALRNIFSPSAVRL